MKLGKPVEITSGIYQLRTIGARVTVITAGDAAVLVDAGARGNLGSISGGLRALGLALEPVPSPFRSSLIASATRPIMHMLYGPPVDVDHPLDDDDHLPLDGELGDITVIHTPGHTVGSICLYMPSREVVIVGDALQYRSQRLGPPAASVTEDSGLALESLKKLLPLEFEIICFSHFPPLKGDARGALRRMLEWASGRPTRGR